MKIEREQTNPRIDRRVARTRAALQDALIALIPERGYAAVTVEDICAKANIGRSTFYAHYVDKEALRTATIDAHLHSLSSDTAADGIMADQGFRFSLPMLRHAQAARTLHVALMADNGGPMHDEVLDRVRRSIRHELDGRPAHPVVPHEFVVHFVAGAFVSVLRWWLLDGGDMSPEEADRMFQQMTKRA